MELIFDTNALVWLAQGHPRLSRKVVEQLIDPDTRTFVSAVIAWEYSDLHKRGRLPGSVPLDEIGDEVSSSCSIIPRWHGSSSIAFRTSTATLWTGCLSRMRSRRI